MALLGLLLILASGALAAGIVLGSTGDSSTQVAWFDQLTRHTTIAGVFALGAAAGVALVLGFWILGGGLKRGRRRRVERKRIAAERREEASALEERNAELERTLAQTRAAVQRRNELNKAGSTPDYPAYPEDSTVDEASPVTGRHRRR